MISFTIPGKTPSTANLRERIERLSIPEPNTGCWLWIGDTVKGGYGRLRLPSRKVLAHRASYEFHKGPIPSGLFVLHSCDQPACVNPSHLRVGSHAENMEERDRKGRGRIPRALGERCGSAKLTRSEVIAIRSEYAAGGISQSALAQQWGITQITVSCIVRRLTWRHVP